MTGSGSAVRAYCFLSSGPPEAGSDVPSYIATKSQHLPQSARLFVHSRIAKGHDENAEQTSR